MGTPTHIDVERWLKLAVPIGERKSISRNPRWNLCGFLSVATTNGLLTEVLMTDPIENVVAPAAIERALSVYQRLNPCDQSVLLQARKIVTQHIYGMVDKGECDEQRLTVGGLARLKSVERDHAIRSASASG
jgi:hypothetical protein